MKFIIFCYKIKLLSLYISRLCVNHIKTLKDPVTANLNNENQAELKRILLVYSGDQSWTLLYQPYTSF